MYLENLDICDSSWLYVIHSIYITIRITCLSLEDLADYSV